MPYARSTGTKRRRKPPSKTEPRRGERIFVTRRCLCLLLLAGSRLAFAQTGTANPGPVQINESVDVHAADAPDVDVPGLRSTVSGPDAAALPLNGRSFIPLVALVPGVALPQGSALPRINGGRPRTN